MYEYYLGEVKQNGYALRFVPHEDRTPVLYTAAVRQDGRALQYAPLERLTLKLYAARRAHATLARHASYTLVRNTYGRYNAACLSNLTHAQELKHWGSPRIDERAVLFTQVLLNVS